MATLYLHLLLIYLSVCSSIANWLIFCTEGTWVLLFQLPLPIFAALPLTSALPLPNGCSSIAPFLLFHFQLATFYPPIATYLPHLSGIPMPVFGSFTAKWLIVALPLKGAGAITDQLRLNPSFWVPSRLGFPWVTCEGRGSWGNKDSIFATSQKRGCAGESERGRRKAKNSPKKCPWKIQIFAKNGIQGTFFLHEKKTLLATPECF